MRGTARRGLLAMSEGWSAILSPIGYVELSFVGLVWSSTGGYFGSGKGWVEETRSRLRNEVADRLVFESWRTGYSV